MPQPSSICALRIHWTPAAVLIAAALLTAPTLRAQLPHPIDPNFDANPSDSQPLDPSADPRQRMGRFPRNLATPPSTLPPTQPTSLPQSTPVAAAAPAANTLPAPMAATPLSSAPPSSKPKRAVVSYINGELNVRADDSSLNQILRSISRLTGLKITGGVADQRVFGDYGPATTASVLATLLDGTGTNILLLEGDATTPPELVLTVRGGGPTPPSPSSSQFDDAPDPPPAPPAPQLTVPQQAVQQQPRPQQAPSGPPSVPQPFNNVNGSPLNTSPTASTLPTTNSVSTDSLPTPSTTPSVSGIVDAPNPPPPGTTTSPAPAATPEQIYQELLKMKQKPNPPQQ
jgi:hypothetical protein